MSSTLNEAFIDAMDEIAGKDSVMMLYLLGLCNRGYRYNNERNSL